MTASERDPATRRFDLANWLALLALLALGVVWPGEEDSGLAARSARAVRSPTDAGVDRPVVPHTLVGRALPARNAREITRIRPACARRDALG